MWNRDRQVRPSRLAQGLALLLLLPVLAAPCAAGAGTITPDQAGVGNFGQVNENYYRGAQPDAAGFQRLGTLGIKTVIDLQEKGQRDEPGWVKAAGMQYYCIPLSSSRPATEQETAQFLQLVNDPHNWPVYVHCAGGRHRTGEMTGIYRITHDTWTADKAFGEMKQYGYYSFPNHGSLRDEVFKYYDSYRLASARPAAAAPGQVAETSPPALTAPGAVTQ